jgi:hypothetical protein
MEYSFEKWLEAAGNPPLQALEQKAYNALLALMRDVDAHKNDPDYAKFFEKENKVIYSKRLEKMLRALTPGNPQIEVSLPGMAGSAIGGTAGGLIGGIPGAIAGALGGGYLAQKGYDLFKKFQPTDNHYKIERTALWALAGLIDFIQKNYDSLDDTSKLRVYNYWKLLHSTANVLDASQARTYHYTQKQQQYGRRQRGWTPERSWGDQYGWGHNRRRRRYY